MNIRKLNEELRKMLEDFEDEPIDDEYENLRNILFEYAQTEPVFEDGYITNLDLEQFDSNNWLSVYTNSDYIIVAKEEGYPVIEKDNIVYIGDPDLTEEELRNLLEK